MTLLEDATDFFGTDALQDPYPLYDRMRDQASVHRIGDSVFYAVCGWDAVMEALNRVEDFSSNLTATMVYHDDGTVTPFDMGPLGGPQNALATADDPVHDAHRKVLVPHLSARPDVAIFRLDIDRCCFLKLSYFGSVKNGLEHVHNRLARIDTFTALPPAPLRIPGHAKPNRLLLGLRC